MRTATILTTAVFSLCLSTVGWGQRALTPAEVQSILQQVTSNPRRTWVPTGTIQATHREYGAAKTTNPTTIDAEIARAISEYSADASKRELTAELQKMKLDAIPFNVRHRLSNEYTMISRVTVRYDGERFYWEINMDSRSDSVLPDATLAGNYMTEQFDRNANRNRVFAWNGQTYTTYAGNQAFVDAANRLPRAVNGPLTAGLIPWGYGKFSYANLAAASASASEVGGTINMTLDHPDASTTSLTLDSSRAYAVTKAVLTGRDNSTVTFTCSGYQQVAGSWVPSTVSIERQNNSLQRRLPDSELWTFTSVSGNTPSLSSFSVALNAGAIVQYASPVTASPVTYVYSHTVDAEELLTQRLIQAAGEQRTPQNCATGALRYVASQFGKSVSDSALTRLVGPNGRTTLADLRKYTQGLGLYCRVVKADLATLKNLQGVKAILHIPGRNHFVALDHVDDQHLWLVDLSSNRFYYRESVHFFPTQWSEGTAMLISDRPIPGEFKDLADSRLDSLTGGAGYTCTNLIQEADWAGCYFISGSCYSTYQYYHERWGCEEAPTGTCYNSSYVRYQESPCIDDFIYDCSITCEWYYYYMWACG